MDALTIRDFRLTWVGIRVAAQCGPNPRKVPRSVQRPSYRTVFFGSGHRHECIDLIDRGSARKKAQELCRFPGPDAGAFDDDCCSRILARFDIPSSDRPRRPRACSCRPLFHVGHCQELA